MKTNPALEKESNAATQTLLNKGLLNPFVDKRIKSEIRALIRTRKIHAQDAGDIRQEILLELVKCFESFNSEHSAFETFVSAVIFKAARKAARDIWTNRRDSCLFCQSLNESANLVEDGGEDSLGDAVSEDEVAMYLGKRERTRHEQNLLVFEMQEFLSTLPKIQKSVCKELMNGKTISEIASRKKIPRSTFYRNILLPIRTAMENAQLQNNLSLNKIFNIL